MTITRFVGALAIALLWAVPAQAKCFSTDDRYPCGAGVDMMGQSFRGEPIAPRLARSKTTRKRVVSDTASRACLPGSITRKLDEIESRFGKVKVVATRAGRPPLSNGRPSYHERCEAVDFEPKLGTYGAVAKYLDQTWPGTVITYSGRLHHIHFDIGHKGRYHKTAEDHTHEVAPELKLASAAPGLPLIEERAPMDPPAAIVPLVPIPDETADARAYLKQIAGYGGTMAAQGRDAVMTRLRATIEAPNLITAFKEATARGEVRDAGISASIDSLHPDYAVKLAKVVKEARAKGLPEARPFSCLRPPVYRVGGMRDKAASCHAYGLVCDMAGIGWARSKDSEKFAAIARAGGLHRPWKSAWEHNHWQMVPHKVCGTAAMRKTITKDGPIDLQKMWDAGTQLAKAPVPMSKKRYAKKRYRVAAR